MIPSLCFYNNTPTISYVYPSLQRVNPHRISLYFAQASNNSPQSKNDWKIHEIQTNCNRIDQQCITIFNNKPVIVFSEYDTNQLKMAMSLKSNPQKSSDWKISILENVFARDLSVGIFNGSLCLAYIIEKNSHFEIRFAILHSTNNLNNDKGVSVIPITLFEPGNAFKNLELVKINDKPVIVFVEKSKKVNDFRSEVKTQRNTNLKLIYPTSWPPSKPRDWEIKSILSDRFNIKNLSTCSSNGEFSILLVISADSYKKNSNNNGLVSLLELKAAKPMPESMADIYLMPIIKSLKTLEIDLVTNGLNSVKFYQRKGLFCITKKRGKI
jgi:hypothetical protein